MFTIIAGGSLSPPRRNHTPNDPAARFVPRDLDDLERSPTTVRGYAYDLKLFWDFQAHDLDWREVGLGELAGFVAWLCRGSSRVVSLEEQQARRSESTINAELERTGTRRSSNVDPTSRSYGPLHPVSRVLITPPA
jgi:hypothetical protein